MSSLRRTALVLSISTAIALVVGGQAFAPAASTVPSMMPTVGPTGCIGGPADFNGDGCSDLAVGVPNEDLGGANGVGAVNVIYGAPGGLVAMGNQLWHQNSGGVLGVAEEGDGFGRALATGDWNDDGFSDLAVGVPLEDFPSATNGGAVHVLFGSFSGLTSAGNQFWTQNRPGILDKAETNDRFGSALAAGDFDGDGVDDLVIGVELEDLELVGTSPIADAGAVHVLYGVASTGLTATGNQLWHQNSPGVLGVAEPLDRFGWSLGAGDITGDLRDDLVVGVPGEDIPSATDVGGINVLLGSASGISGVGDQFFTQNKAGVLDVAEVGDEFGTAVAVGDFNADSFFDVFVGVPYEDVGPMGDAGAGNVLYGSGTGLTTAGNQFWHQDSLGVLDSAFGLDHFGLAVVAGDFNGDSFFDVFVSVVDENVSGLTDTGAGNVLYGALGGLTATGNQFWHQDSPGILDDAEGNDRFGFAVSAGDFNGDGASDVAVGVPEENLALPDVGVANVIYGAVSTGLVSAGNQLWHQDSPGILDVGEDGDDFGWAVAPPGSPDPTNGVSV